MAAQRRHDDAAWSMGYARLEKFSEKYGHTYVPAQGLYRGYPLGVWVSRQRELYREASLSRDRAAALERLAHWDWCVRKTDRWPVGFAQLQVYAAQHGHCFVPARHVTRDGFRLGSWVNHTRSMHRKGTLPPMHAGLVENLPGWMWNSYDARWNNYCELTRRFAAEHGHLQVPVDYDVDGVRLWVWLRRQRNTFRLLSRSRQRQLESIPGWDSHCYDRRWEIGFSRLQEYVGEHGHAQVPVLSVCEDGYRLGQWVSVQRRSYRQENLRKERVTRLEELSGWTWDRRNPWDEGYAKLVTYTEETGNADPPVRYVCEDGYALGQWTRAQRTAMYAGKLSEERRLTLESLPGWVWSARTSPWETGFGHLSEFVREFGHAGVAANYVCGDGFELGQWAEVQRASRRRWRMWPQRRERLETLPGWRW